jgi:hypothetical protein
MKLRLALMMLISVLSSSSVNAQSKSGIVRLSRGLDDIVPSRGLRKTAG